MFFRSNKEIRRQLEFIAKLCEKGTSVEEIEAALSEIDGLTLQKLGPIRADGPRQLQRAANRVLRAIPRSGPDPKRARRQFIGDLIRSFDCARGTGGQSGRRVDKAGQEYGPLREFVRAALEPFHAWQGCEADIKVALCQRNRAG